jgi:hypothetical protein
MQSDGFRRQKRRRQTRQGRILCAADGDFPVQRFAASNQKFIHFYLD